MLLLKFERQRRHTQLQFLRAVSYSVGAHSSRLCDDDADSSDVDNDDDDNAAVADIDSQAVRSSTRQTCQRRTMTTARCA